LKIFNLPSAIIKKNPVEQKSVAENLDLVMLDRLTGALMIEGGGDSTTGASSSLDPNLPCPTPEV